MIGHNMSKKYPCIELVSTSKCLHGGWEVVILINDDYFERLHYYGYSKEQAETLAKDEAMKIAGTYFFNQ